MYLFTSVFARSSASGVGRTLRRLLLAAALGAGLLVAIPRQASASDPLGWMKTCRFGPDMCSEGDRVVATAALHKGQLYGFRGTGAAGYNIPGRKLPFQDLRAPTDCRGFVGQVLKETGNGQIFTSVPALQVYYRTTPPPGAHVNDLKGGDLALIDRTIQDTMGPGDLIVFGPVSTFNVDTTDPKILNDGTHVGIYDGQGNIWNAESSTNTKYSRNAPYDGSRPGVQLDPYTGFGTRKNGLPASGIFPTMLIYTGLDDIVPKSSFLPTAPEGAGPFSSRDDFNGDKRGDILALKDGVMSLYPSTGFNVGAPISMQSGPSLSQMASIFSPGDWNGDSYPDLLAVNGSKLLLYEGGPTGFAASKEEGLAQFDWSQYDEVFSPGHYPGGPATPDLFARNKDGLWLISNKNFDNPIPVAEGDWSLSAFLWVFSPGDWNKDNLPDIIAVDDILDAQGNTTMWIYLGQLDSGKYGLASRVRIGGGWQGMDYVFSPGDFDGDANHFPDVIARNASDGGLWLYKGTGKAVFPGSFSGVTQIGWKWTTMASIFSPGDFSGSGVTANGTTDVLAVNDYGGLVFYQGTKTGFVAGKQVPVGPMDWSGNGTKAFFSLGDIQGDAVAFRDGHPDVAVVQGNGELKLYPGVGVTLSEKPRRIGAVGRGPTPRQDKPADPTETNWASMKWVFSPGDFDGGELGLPDIITVDEDGDMWLYTGTLLPDASYDLKTGVWIGGAWGGMKWVFSGGDYTGDGYPDVAAVVSNSGELLLYENNRAGRLSDPKIIGTGWQNFDYVFSPGDLGPDGLADVLARDANGEMWLYVPAPAPRAWSSVHLKVAPPSSAAGYWSGMTLSR